MSDLVPALEVVDGVPTVTSVQIAAHFGKQHKHVMRAIRDLVAQLATEHQPNYGQMLVTPEHAPNLGDTPVTLGHQRNFAQMFVTTEIGNNAFRRDPAYRLTRDGFTLLAMGFTGKEALRFKLAYIDSFNRMEAELRRQAVTEAAAAVECPAPPRIPTHQADLMVAASRTFNALLRSGQAARMPLPAVIRRAAAVALRETGIDLLEDLDAHAHVHALEVLDIEQHTQGASLHPGAAEFFADWSGGALDIPYQSCLTGHAYQAYAHWCSLTRQATTARREVFTTTLIRCASAAHQHLQVKVMRLGTGPGSRVERVLLVTPPPDEAQGAWAKEVTDRFAVRLRSFVGTRVAESTNL